MFAQAIFNGMKCLKKETQLNDVDTLVEYTDFQGSPLFEEVVSNPIEG